MYPESFEFPVYPTEQGHHFKTNYKLPMGINPLRPIMLKVITAANKNCTVQIINRISQNNSEYHKYNLFVVIDIYLYISK